MTAKQFNVAFTKIASLLFISHILMEQNQSTTYSEFSWSTVKSRSNSPDASASKLGITSVAWVRGTIAMDVSFFSGRWT
jgi:hypothetical protein